MKKTVTLNILTIFLLGFCLLIFYYPTLISGRVYSLGGVMGSGLILTDLPSFKLYKDALANFSFPWWVSGIGNGYPLVGGLVLGAFYPLNILLFSILPINLAVDWSVFFHICLSTLGVYAIVVTFTKNRLAAIYGAITFALSGYTINQILAANLFLAFSLFPWIFLYFWYLTEKFRISGLIILSLLFGLQILAGYPTMAYYSWVILFFTALFKAKLSLQKVLINLGLLLLAIILSLLLTSVQLIPTLELIGQSNRNLISYREATIMAYPKEAFLTFLGQKYSLIPEIELKQSIDRYIEIKSFNSYYSYLGKVSLILIIFGIIWVFKYKKYLPVLGLVIISFLLTLGNSTPVFYFFWKIIPGMNYFRLSIYFLGFLELFLSILVGFGLTLFLEKLSKIAFFKRKTLLISIIGLIIITANFIDLYSNNSKIEPTQTFTFWQQKPPVVDKLVEKLDYDRITTIFPLNFNDWTYVTDWKMQYFLRNYLPPNYSTLFNIQSAQIRVPIYITRKDQIEASSLPVDLLLSDEIRQQLQNPGKLNFPLDLPDSSYQVYKTQGIKLILTLFPLNHPKLKLYWQSPLPTLMELKVLGNIDLTGNFGRLPLKVDNLFVYELTDNLPRAAFIREANMLSSEQAVMDEIISGSFNPSVKVLVEGNSSDTFSGETGYAQITKDEESKLKVLFNSTKGGWLYLSDTYYPGWKAYTDGIETKIYKANYAFRAIKITQPGKHNAEFIYDPISRKIGIAISLTSILILLVIFIKRKKIEQIMKTNK